MPAGEDSLWVSFLGILFAVSDFIRHAIGGLERFRPVGRPQEKVGNGATSQLPNGGSIPSGSQQSTVLNAGTISTEEHSSVSQAPNVASRPSVPAQVPNAVRLPNATTQAVRRVPNAVRPSWVATHAGRFYVVVQGRQRGVFRSWEECNSQVFGFSDCKHKSFAHIGDAEEYWREWRGDEILKYH